MACLDTPFLSEMTRFPRKDSIFFLALEVYQILVKIARVTRYPTDLKTNAYVDYSIHCFFVKDRTNNVES